MEQKYIFPLGLALIGFLSDNGGTMSTTLKTPIEVAIERAGGFSTFARALDLKSAAVARHWIRLQVPAAYCPDIEELTGVACEDLRPDVKWYVLRGKARPAKPRTPSKAPQ